MKKLIPLLLLPLLLKSATIINGGFETGDLTGWTFTGEVANSFNSRVEGGAFTEATSWASQFNFFSPQNIEGDHSFFSGFDGPIQQISLSQSVGIIDESTSAISFKVRAAWDLETYSQNSTDVQNNEGVVLDREIRVMVIDNQTNETLIDQSLFNAVGGEFISDSGLTMVGIELDSVVGHDVTLSFVQNIPQAYTGPALIQIDDIQLQQTYIPEYSGYSLLFGFGVFIYTVIRYKYARKKDIRTL